MRSLRPILLGAALVLLAAAGIYFVLASNLGDGERRPTDDPSRTVRIMDGMSVSSLHVLVAEERNYFEAQGLNVEVSYCPIGKACMDALNAGGVHYAGVVEMNIAHTLFAHDDIAILAEYSEPIRAIKVLGRRDRGVSSVSELRGKRIGVFFGVNIHTFIVKLLEEAEIPLGEVELVNLMPPDAAAAFISGDIDAIVSWHPIVDNIMQRLGDRAVLLTDDAQRYWPWKALLVTRRSRLERYSDEAERVLRALLMADDYIAENPDTACSLFARERNLDPERALVYCDENDYRIQITPRLLEMIQYETKWLPRHLPEFFERREPVTHDFRSLVAPQLRDLRPDAWHLD